MLLRLRPRLSTAGTVPRRDCLRAMSAIAGGACMLSRSASSSHVSRQSRSWKSIPIACMKMQQHTHSLLGTRHLSTESTTVDPSSNKKEHISAVLARVMEVQTAWGESSPAWLERVSRRATEKDAPFRITVVGSTFSGVDVLTNSLLLNEDPYVVPELSGQGEQPLVHRISFGESLLRTNENDAVNIKTNVDWLKSSSAELVVVPTETPDLKSWEDAIYLSDLTILVTDAAHPFSTPREKSLISQMIQRNATKNILVAVNNTEAFDHLPDSTTVAISNAQKSLDELISLDLNSSVTDDAALSTSIPLFPISTRSGRRALNCMSPDSPPSIRDTFTSVWNASGIQDIKSHILSTLSTSSPSREETKLNATKFTASVALSRLESDQTTTMALVSAISRKSDDVLKTGISAVESRLVHDFEMNEVASISQYWGGLTVAVKDFFGKLGLGSLLLHSDSISDDLKAFMRAHSLLQVEYKMSYAVGKLNEGLFTLYERTRAELKPITSTASPLSAYTTTRALQKDVARIIAILDKQSPPNGVQVDPFKLRNIVATFDESKQADLFQEKTQELIRYGLGTQLFFATSGVFVTYLGVPFAISVPSTLLLSVAGFAFHRLKWMSLQEHFISNIEQSQAALQAKLLAAYNKDFTRVVSEPIASIVKLLDDALAARLKEVQDGKTEIEELSKLIRKAKN